MTTKAIIKPLNDAPPSSLINSNVGIRWNNRRVRSWGTLPILQHFGGRGACWSFGMGLGRMPNNQSFTRTYTNQTTSWLMHSWSTFGAKTSHEQTRTHKTHHDPDLGEATTFPLIVYFVLGHGTNTQMAFCPETPKCPKILVTLGAHNFVYRPPIEMRLKAKL
jgi:hypothetical protein